MTTRPGSVLIAIATYRRPAQLAQLLRSLQDQLKDYDASVLVVDNDRDGSAAQVCANSGCGVRYLIERQPGIAAARNRALSQRAGHEFICFVDDDETVEPDWLVNLINCALKHEADIVSGPVRPQFTENVPAWVVEGRYFAQLRRRTGDQVRLPATNNTLVRTTAIDDLTSPRFDEKFSFTGGSDNELFWRMQRDGKRSVWCDEAVVAEHIHPSRWNARWICRRGIRHGNVLARLRLREVSRNRVLVEGLARIGYGATRTIMRCLIVGRPSAVEIGTFLRGVGMVHALLGQPIEEYRR